MFADVAPRQFFRQWRHESGILACGEEVRTIVSIIKYNTGDNERG